MNLESENAAARGGAADAERRVAFARDRGTLAERALGRALAEMIRWRAGGGAAPSDAAFVTAVLAAARDPLDRLGIDGRTRLRFTRLLESKARRFAGSPLGRRLRAMPIGRLVAVPSARRPEIVLRDARGGVHLVAVVREGDAFELGRRAGSLAAANAGAADSPLAPLTVHLHSLVTDRRTSYRFTDVAARAKRNVA